LEGLGGRVSHRRWGDVPHSPPLSGHRVPVDCWRLSDRAVRDQFSVSNGLIPVILMVIFSGALALRRLSPGLALSGAWLDAILQMAFALKAPQPFDLAVLAILFVTAS